jgi:uncharacterized membrane protein YgcG
MTSVVGTEKAGASFFVALSLICLCWFSGCAKPPSDPEPVAKAPKLQPEPAATVDSDDKEGTGLPAPPIPATEPAIAPLLEDQTEPFVDEPDVVQAPETEPTPKPEIEGAIVESALEPIVETVAAENVSPTEDGNRVEEVYEELAPYGEWIGTETYGTVWQPANAMNTKWRPYTDGTWAVADEGWTWVSNEPFGATCYHYGRWAILEDCGWVWVPGTEWAPAWVAWRADDRFAGWAPLPPEYTTTYVGVDTTYWVDSGYSPGPLCYNYVPIDQVCATNCATSLVSYSIVVDLFADTHDYTRFHRNERKTVCSSGPHERHFRSRHMPKKLTAKQRELCDRTPPDRGSAKSESQNSRVARVNRNIGIAKVDRGWSTGKVTVAQRGAVDRGRGPSVSDRRKPVGGERAVERARRKGSEARRAEVEDTRKRTAARTQQREESERARKVESAEKGRKRRLSERAKSDEAAENARRSKLVAAREQEQSQSVARRKASEEEGRKRQVAEAREREQKQTEARSRADAEESKKRQVAEASERARKQTEARRKASEEEGRKRQVAAAREREQKQTEARRKADAEEGRKRQAAAKERERQQSEARKRAEESKRKAASEQAERARAKRDRDEREARQRESARRKQEADNQRRESQRRESERRESERREQARRDEQRQADEKRREESRRSEERAREASRRSSESSSSSSSSSSRSSGSSSSRSSGGGRSRGR